MAAYGTQHGPCSAVCLPMTTSRASACRMASFNGALAVCRQSLGKPWKSTGDELRDMDAFISLPGGQQLPGTTINSPSRPARPWIRVVTRLAPGIPLSRALQEMQIVHSQLQRDYPRPAALLRSIRVVPLPDKLTQGARSSLVVLQGAVAFVLPPQGSTAPDDGGPSFLAATSRLLPRPIWPAR